MKLAIESKQYKQVRALQQMFDVTIVSNKGLVFMYRDDWQKICGELSAMDNFIAEHVSEVSATEGYVPKLARDFDFWSKCFIVAGDESGYCTCHAICDFDFFNEMCSTYNITPVLVPFTYDLVDYISGFNSEDTDIAGCYIASRGDVVIEVEDN